MLLTLCLLMTIGLNVIKNGALAKCGVEYLRDDTRGTSDFASKRAFCNDMEMFEMCNRAQLKVDRFADLLSQHMLINKIITDQTLDFNSLEGTCDQSIVCYHDFDIIAKNGELTNEEIYCENKDLYNACQSIKNNFDAFIREISAINSLTSTLQFAPIIKCHTSENPNVIPGNVVSNDSNINNYSIVAIILAVYYVLNF